MAKRNKLSLQEKIEMLDMEECSVACAYTIDLIYEPTGYVGPEEMQSIYQECTVIRKKFALTWW